MQRGREAERQRGREAERQRGREAERQREMSVNEKFCFQILALRCLTSLSLGTHWTTMNTSVILV